MYSKRVASFLALLVAFSLILSACTPEKVIETVVVTQIVEKEGTPQVIEVVVTPTTPPEVVVEKPSVDNRAEVVRFALLSDLDGTNPFYLLDVTGQSYWNQVVTTLYYPTLYGVSDQRWDYIPYLADGIPGEIVKEGELWVGTIKLKEGLKWSDNSPLTSEDVAFTANTVLLFSLSGNWVSYYNPEVLDRVEAVDPLTIKFYFKIQPGIPVWQYGALFGPVVNKAYWEPKIGDLVTQAQALDRTAADYLDLIAPIQQSLEALPTDGEPTYGPMKFKRWEEGAYAENNINENNFTIGMTVEEFTNGAYREFSNKFGHEFVAYGTPEGNMALEVPYGPFFETVLYPVYSQDAAYLALQSGEVDIVLNPSGLSQGLRDQLSGDPNIQIVRNAQNGFRYIEFNQAKPYFQGETGKAVRQAIACQINLDFLTQNVLQGQVEPVYTLVPSDLTYWYNPEVPIFCQGMTEAERITEAARILTEAGFTWDVPPSYNDGGGSARDAGVIYGVGMKLPDGTPFPEIDLQAPGPGYDPLRATSAVFIEQWIRQLGIPVMMEYTPFNTIRANENSGDFDIIMLGWGLGVFPSYLCDFFTGATGVADGSDNIGYVSPTLNEQCQAFYEATDLDVARQIAFDMQVTIATELPYITLFTNPIFDAYATSINYPFTTVFDGIQGIYGAGHLVQPNTKQ
ncbi:MAG TPA: ABC transporter substrate-binding protein [Anaerolineaceae bacterium]|nr:ABC transporter substrate-binding protein [Anaerolineaceae bacterium]